MKRMRLLRTWCLALVIAATAFLAAPLATQRAASAPDVSDIPRLAFEKYTLPNGLDIILSEDKRLPLVAVNLWYHVGPANEEPGRTGFAHLFEHMMFQSSKHVPPDTHFRFLEAAGATDINGTTDFDRTNYFETVPSNQLELALWLESDRMGYLLDTLDAKQLANQQDVVRNERRQTTENVPYGIAREKLMQTIFPPGHPYYADVIGSHQDIQSAKLDDVKRFFKQYYAPNNASLAIVGDFDKAQTRALVTKYFGTFKRGEPVPPIKATTPPITQERRRTVEDRVQLPRVYLAWITPAAFKPGDADAEIAAGILGGGRSSRLFKRLVYEKQIAQNVNAFQNSLTLGSVFQIQATARPGHTAAELEQALDEELDKLGQSPPEQAEIERARNSIETGIIERLETLGGFGGVADRLNLYNQYLGMPDYLPQDIARYRAVTPESVRSFVTTSLAKNRRVVLEAVPGRPDLGPEVATPPPPQTREGEGAESINADESWRSTPPKGGAVHPLKLDVPESARLANGLTLILSQRRGLPVVAADVVIRTGSDANPLDQPGLASFTLAMLDQGTASKNALQIADALAQLGARVTTATTMDASFIRGQSLKKTFSEMLGIMADVALHPSFPTEEIERQRAGRLGQLVQQKDNAGVLAGNAMAAALYGRRHPYGFNELGTEASVKAISQTDMRAFWRQNFVPSNAALVVAGDISMSELKSVAAKTFGSWTGTAPRPRALGQPETTKAHVIIVDRPGAPQTQLRVAGIGAPRSTSDFRAIQVMNLALGGLFSSRIYHDLREEKGYTYGARSRFDFRRTAGPFAVSTGVRTEVTAPAVTAIFVQLRGMFDNPMTPVELKMAKDSLAQSLPGSFETSADATGSFSNVYIYDLGLDYFTKYAADVAAVTLGQAQTAAEKYILPDRFIVVAVGDRAKIQPELEKLSLGPIEVKSSDDFN